MKTYAELPCSKFDVVFAKVERVVHSIRRGECHSVPHLGAVVWSLAQLFPEVLFARCGTVDMSSDARIVHSSVVVPRIRVDRHFWLEHACGGIIDVATPIFGRWQRLWYAFPYLQGNDRYAIVPFPHIHNVYALGPLRRQLSTCMMQV